MKAVISLTTIYIIGALLITFLITQIIGAVS